MQHDFEVEIADDDAAVVMSIRGEVDLRHREALATTALRLVAQEPLVIADLSAVTFLDSTGLGVLIEVRNEATRRGHEFRVRCPTDAVARLLAMTGLQRWLAGDA